MNKVIFDSHVLSSWQKIDPEGWQNIVADLIMTFLEVVPQQFAQLRSQLNKKNFVEVRKISHSLKSACGNVGAESARDILNQIEMDESITEEKMQELVGSLDEIFLKTQAEMVNFKKLIQAD